MPAELNIQKSLEAANGNADLAKELFSMLINELTERSGKIETSFREKNYAALEENAHKLYGATAYCVVPELRENAGNLEAALKQKNYTKIDELVKITLENINEIQQKAPGYLDQEWR